MKTDEELLHDFIQGNDMAFAALYNRHKRPVYVYALKMLSDAEAAADALQTVFLSLHQRRGLLIEDVRAWIFTCARNHCLNELRRRSRLDEGAVIEEIPGPSFEELMEEVEEGEQVRRALSNLRPEYREALILREYDGFSYAEIARITASSESAVKSRLFKARRQMYDVLKPLFMKG